MRRRAASPIFRLPCSVCLPLPGADPCSLQRGRGKPFPPTAHYFKQGGEGIERISLDRHADAKVAQSIYRTSIERYPGRLIMLCDGARVLIRSDRPDATR